MENYSYTSYPESGDSSPRSREVDFENPPPWEDSSSPSNNYKVRFMCSYGGKIHPRPHDNQLSYIGGETKILSVERSIKLSAFLAKLASLSASADVSFKYQLPGEDLDALISVTNEDDLEHMMTEYDRLYRASPKPARLRLFILTSHPPPPSHAQGDPKSDRDRFVEALNSAPADTSGIPAALPTVPGVPAPQNVAVDYLFGFEKGAGAAAVHPPPPPKILDPSPDPVLDRTGSPDPNRIPVDIQRHIHDLQRLQLQDQAMYGRRSSEDCYAPQKLPEKAPQPMPPQNLPITPPANVQVPQAYWTEKIGGGGGDQPMFMIPAATAGLYHAPPPVGRPMPAPGGQAAAAPYYQVHQRTPTDVYREQQQHHHQQQQQQQQQAAAAYNVYSAQQTVAAPPPQQNAKLAYSEGIGMGRPVADMGYAQVAYDSAGRQVYYTGAGGMVAAPYPGMTAVKADMRQGPQESKVIPK